MVAVISEMNAVLSQTVWLCVLTGFLAAFIRLVGVVQFVLPGFREIIGFWKHGVLVN